MAYTFYTFVPNKDGHIVEGGIRGDYMEVQKQDTSCSCRVGEWYKPKPPEIENVGAELTIKHSCGGDVTLNRIYKNEYDISHELVCAKCGWKKALYGVDG